MNNKTIRRQINASRVLLAILLISIGFHIGMYFQVEQQLTSPLIPKETVQLVTYPYLWSGLISVFTTLLALFFYLKTRYPITITVCIVTLAFQQLCILVG
jgi:hypothetical protein